MVLNSYEYEYEYEYESLDELIAIPLFARCACYYRYIYGRLAGVALHGILPSLPLEFRLPATGPVGRGSLLAFFDFIP